MLSASDFFPEFLEHEVHSGEFNIEIQLWQRGRFFLKATKISLKKNTMIGTYPKVQNILQHF